MANRRPQGGGGRRMDFVRNDRGKNFGRSGVSPWQGGGPGMSNLLPLGGGSTEATLALASNLINLLQPQRPNPVPSLLDMPIRRDFGHNVGRFDRPYIPNRMGNQNFRRTGNYNRAGERINTNRKPFRPNDGPRQQNKSPKKEADSKAKPVKESEDVKKEPDTPDTDKDGVTDDKKDVPKTRYDEVNPALLKCHICNKSMWDGRSFENHLSGRAHGIMMQKTAESYALTADTMRQEFKIREMKHARRSGQHGARDFYCAMCDMYAADGAAHRTTIGHRKLKKYLHPTCTSCHKELPTRIELDEHRLSAEHLKNVQDKHETVTKPKPEVMVISTLTTEQSYLREYRNRRHRDDDGKDADDKQDDVEVKKEKVDEGEGEGETKQEGEKKEIDAEDTVLDYQEGDDLSGVTADQFPVYSVERGVGRSFLADFRCVQCKLCRKLLDTDETAEVHLRTWRHHQLFTRLISDKAAPREQAAESTEAPEPAAEAAKRPLELEEDGDWKRRKATPDDQPDQNGHDDDDKQVGSEAEADGDVEMPPADELEDWEQSVDETTQDEQNADEQEVKEEPEPEKVELKAPSPPPAPVAPVAPATPVTPATPATPKATATPRGRGRGRLHF